MNSELRINVTYMSLHSAHRYHETLTNLLVALAKYQLLKNLTLSLR